MRDTTLLNTVIEDIATTHGRLDGLIAAAGVQQETPALEYTAADANRLLEINVTGVFMTAQAVARQVVRFGRGEYCVDCEYEWDCGEQGMPSPCSPTFFIRSMNMLTRVKKGPALPRLQRQQSRCSATNPQPSDGMGSVQYSG